MPFLVITSSFRMRNKVVVIGNKMSLTLVHRLSTTGLERALNYEIVIAQVKFVHCRVTNKMVDWSTILSCLS